MTDLSTVDLDLDAIEKRAEAATPGPWMLRDVDVVVAPGRGLVSRDSANVDDAAFIAAARTDVPALCAAVRAAEDDASSWRLRHKDACAEIADLRAKLSRAETPGPVPAKTMEDMAREWLGDGQPGALVSALAALLTSVRNKALAEALATTARSLTLTGAARSIRALVTK